MMHYARVRKTGETGTAEPLRAAKSSDKECSVEGCSTVCYGKGLCSKHWQRLRAKGHTDDPPAPKEWCMVEECLKPHFAKGMCVSHYNRDHWLRKAYGLSWDALQHRMQEQDNKCIICRMEFSPQEQWKVHVDHDHSCCATPVTCGACVRGILCSDCNTGIGSFRDAPNLLRAAADYLESFTETDF